MNKLKIVVFGPKIIPSRSGGVEIAAAQLAIRMAAQGHDVTCYNRGGGQETFYKGICIKPTPTIPGKGLSAVSSSFFAALAAAFSRADICHIHAEGPALMCFLPKLAGKRVIVTVHGLDWQREKWRGSIGSAYIRMGEKMAVRFADKIIVLNRHTQAYFRQRYGRETCFIPNGVEIPRILPPNLISKQFGLQKDGYILYLGRLVPEKGIHDLIRTFRELPTHKRLVIAGASSDTAAYAAHLHDLAAGDPRILFTGFVEGQLLEELYSNAFLYVLPSHLEGMPLGLLEAMSYGNCCIISNIPGCSDAAGGHALTFPAGDTAVLLDTLQQLCMDEALRQKYRSNARNHVRDRFNWDEITRKTLELYDENFTDS